MSLSDPIADFLTRIRNATKAKVRYVDVRWSKLVQNIADVLKEANLVDQYLVREMDGKKEMRLFLRYDMKGQSIIRGLKRVSKPGKRFFAPCDQIESVFNGLGISVLSTSQGVLCDREARKRRVGGEVLCYVW